MFRTRLALFFVLIVIVPMLAVAFLLNSLITSSVMGKIDAGIGADIEVAQEVFREQREAAGDAIDKEIGRDTPFGRALQNGETRAAAARARELIRVQAIERIVFVKNDKVVLREGDRNAIAPAVRQIEVESAGANKPLGRLEVSVIDAESYAKQVADYTRLDVIVRIGDKVVASTLPAAADRRLPLAPSIVEIGGKEYRSSSFADKGAFIRQNVRVFVLGVREDAKGDAASQRWRTLGILLGFFLVAVACAVLVSRSLQQQIAAFLAAARRLASGDFSAKVPTTGRDEFAALGEEFNKMSAELERRLLELGKERERVQDSMRRLGEAVASNLDRDALLELVVRTAIDGVGADAGRASVRTYGSTTLVERTRVGNMNGLEAAVQTVETDALRSGATREANIGEANVIAHPLRAADGVEGAEGVVGIVSIGRSGRPFSPSDRDLFHYLAGQAALSMENVDLHESVTRESVTDDLTGLRNRRAFDDALASEVERSKRFGTDLGLVLIDLDNFKFVNDTYGHPQGDLVLREVARVLRESSREIDHPARYGGEELAVVLPGTDLEGAYNLAERVRVSIAALEVERLDGSGTMRVTTSCGVAAVPATAADERALLAAADEALYEAKRSGKNKSVRAR